MNEFTPTATGLLVPNHSKLAGVRCGFCPTVIRKDAEVNGRLHIFEQKPICPKCRILRNDKSSGAIRSDKPKYEIDVKKRDAHLQEVHNNDVRRLAIESQERTRTKLIKR